MKNICVLKRNENTKEDNSCYIKAIKKFGGNPILINEDNIEDLYRCGGILITGGFTKGNLDDYLIGYALDNHLPLLGICQGMQSMAMYKDSYKLNRVVNHHSDKKYVHSVYLEKSNLKNIIGIEKIMVNSYHYETPPKSNLFKIVGYSSDNLIEAVENPNHTFQIGVQWHPERMIDYDVSSNELFKKFINLIK